MAEHGFYTAETKVRFLSELPTFQEKNILKLLDILEIRNNI